MNFARGADRAATLYAPVFTGLPSDLVVVSPLTEMKGHDSSSDVGSGVGPVGLWMGAVVLAHSGPDALGFWISMAGPLAMQDQTALKTPLAAPEGGQSATVASEVSQASPASVSVPWVSRTRGGPGPCISRPTRRSMQAVDRPWKCRAVEMVANAVALSHIVRGEDSRTPGRTPRVGDLSNALQQHAAAVRAETGPGAVRHATETSRRRSARGASSCPWRSID